MIFIATPACLKFSGFPALRMTDLPAPADESMIQLLPEMAASTSVIFLLT
jgi:hypothetical protein